MRVLMLSWEYPPHSVGGLGKHVSELVPALDQQGIEIHLITPRMRGGEHYIQEDEDTHIYRIEPPQLNWNDFFTVAWQTNLKLQEAAYDLQGRVGQFDLIHVHDWLVAFAGGALKQLYRIPLISTIHATERGRGRGNLPGDLSRAINNVEWWLTFESWKVICCSEYMKGEVREYFETPADKIAVIPNGVSTNRFDKYDSWDLSEFRNRYAASDEKIIFYVGRIVEEKGVRVLIESAPEVLSQYNNAKFVLAGSGPQFDDYKGLVESMGLANRFYFTGFISDEERDMLYRVADVAVFPSLYEPFGIVALEAMAAKVPVVVADTGGLSEVVVNHETGIKVYPGNHGSLAWGILHTLLRPDWAQARVQNAYKAATESFNWGLVAKQTIETYKEVMYDYEHSDWGHKSRYIHD
jgi:glycogen(starch) synthase